LNPFEQSRKPLLCARQRLAPAAGAPKKPPPFNGRGCRNVSQLKRIYLAGAVEDESLFEAELSDLLLLLDFLCFLWCGLLVGELD
jgi:hypothetical protein